jgi:Icc-related predicted phosphoesterase
MIELCENAIELNYSARFRKGNVIYLPDKGKMVVVGDLHGHRRNFERVASFADIDNNPETYVVFQEILHGGIEDEWGGCLSFRLFFDILRYQQKYPENVFLIMGNHDTAIINDSDVMKAGKEMNQAMKAAMKRHFPDEYPQIMLKLKACLLSQPIAVRCANRIWISHSLPANRFVDNFDMGVFDKPLGIEDVVRNEPLYQLTWGRRHNQQALDKLAKMFDVDLFILGHQPQDTGYNRAGDNLLIIASDHNHGCIVPVELDRHYSIDELVGAVIPLASIK